MNITVRENWKGFGAEENINVGATQAEYVRLLKSEIIRGFPGSKVEITFIDENDSKITIDGGYAPNIAPRIQSMRETIYNLHTYWIEYPPLYVYGYVAYFEHPCELIAEGVVEAEDEEQASEIVYGCCGEWTEATTGNSFKAGCPSSVDMLGIVGEV